MTTMRTLLPLLILLGCPLMMIFMMRGGHGHGAAHGSGHDAHRPARTRDERIADLEREIASLRDEPEDAMTKTGRR